MLKAQEVLQLGDPPNAISRKLPRGPLDGVYTGLNSSSQSVAKCAGEGPHSAALASLAMRRVSRRQGVVEGLAVVLQKSSV